MHMLSKFRFASVKESHVIDKLSSDTTETENAHALPLLSSLTKCMTKIVVA